MQLEVKFSHTRSSLWDMECDRYTEFMTCTDCSGVISGCDFALLMRVLVAAHSQRLRTRISPLDCALSVASVRDAADPRLYLRRFRRSESVRPCAVRRGDGCRGRWGDAAAGQNAVQPDRSIGAEVVPSGGGESFAGGQVAVAYSSFSM